MLSSDSVADLITLIASLIAPDWVANPRVASTIAPVALLNSAIVNTNPGVASPSAFSPKDSEPRKTKKRMSAGKAKAKIDFSQETDGNLSSIARNVQTLMLAKAAIFTAPPVTMVAFLALIDDWDTKLAAAKNRGTAEITAKNAARLALEGACWATT